MNKFSFVKVFLFAMVAVIFAVSCDDEYGQLGSDIVGGDIHNSSHRYYGSIVAYDRPTGPVQANGLDVNMLGAYDHPVFGKTTASYVTQVQMASTPAFTEHVVVDSVWIYVPFYSKLEKTTVLNDSTTVNTYSLDSIYGDTIAPFSLKLRKNNFYLRTTDASTGGNASQYYYSDQSTILDNQGESLFEENAPDKQVTFSNEEIIRTARYTNDEGTTRTVKAERLAPGFFMYLDKNIFNNYFVNAPSGKLLNNNVLAEYFRGISFTAEQIGGRSIMGSPKFTDGYIKVKYTQDDFDSNNAPIMETVDGVSQRKRESVLLTLNLKGNHVNLFKNETNNTYLTAINTTNATQGDEKLYLKGGEGSMAFLDILNEADITALKADSVLINEARIKFYVDDATMGNATKPMRVYLYDVNNKRPVYDYYLDQTSSTTVPKYNKIIYGGNLLKDSDGRYFYNIRITNHINNIINKDSTNIKLGLVVSRDITLTSNAALKTPFTENSGTTAVPVKFVPAASVTHPFGVVLHGTNPAVTDDKRIKLEIYYTKPN